MAGLSKELQTCVKYQSYIGWNNFMRGILYHGWSDYQHNLSTVGDKHDPNKKSTWTTNIVEAIMQIGIDVWRERCTVVKAENIETHEKRQRQAALELCNTYRFNLSQIHPKYHSFISEKVNTISNRHRSRTSYNGSNKHSKRYGITHPYKKTHSINSLRYTNHHHH